MSANAINLSELVRSIQDGEDIFAPDATGTTVVHRAAATGHVAALCLIAEHRGWHRITVAPDKAGRTALIVAIIQRQRLASELLLRFGSDPSTPDAYGSSAFFYAINASQLVLVQLLGRGFALFGTMLHSTS